MGLLLSNIKEGLEYRYRGFYDGEDHDEIVTVKVITEFHVVLSNGIATPIEDDGNQKEVPCLSLKPAVDINHNPITKSKDIYIPVRHEFLGLIYFKNPQLNEFQGVNCNELQVLKSAAGYYIGYLERGADLTKDHPNSCYMPYERESYNYWNKREEAETALIENNYRPRYR